MDEDTPVIEITKPEVIFPDLCDHMDEIGMTYTKQYNFDNSHIIFKGQDLGSFAELVKLREDYDNLLKELEKKR